MKNGKTILVIDDEEPIRHLLTDFLEKSNFDAVAMDDGASALEYIKENIPDLVIVDLLLPGEHGIDLIRTIKEEYFLPVIAITGVYKREEVYHDLQSRSVEDFFEKPLDLKKMLTRINEILGA